MHSVIKARQTRYLVPVAVRPCRNFHAKKKPSFQLAIEIFGKPCDRIWPCWRPKRAVLGCWHQRVPAMYLWLRHKLCKIECYRNRPIRWGEHKLASTTKIALRTTFHVEHHEILKTHNMLQYCYGWENQSRYTPVHGACQAWFASCRNKLVKWLLRCGGFPCLLCHVLCCDGAIKKWGYWS